MTNIESIIITLLGLFILWAATYISLDFFRFRVYIVWAIDNAELNTEKFLGIALTKRAAKRIISDDQYRRWTNLEKDKWKVEWRYDPVIVQL